MSEPRFVAVLKVHEIVRDFIARCQAQEALATLHPLLEQVVAAMPSHFADEEEPGGFFEAIVELGIVGAFSVKHLRLDHAELLAQARDLTLNWAHRSEADNRKQLDRFALELGNHEAVESHYADAIEAVAD